MTLGSKGQPSDTGYVSDSFSFNFFWSLSTIARSGPPFNSPTGVSVSSSSEIYISDGYGNARVHKFSPDGKLLLSWGEPGYAPGQFRLPHFILVDKKDRVWVVDRENSRIQIFDAAGKFITQWTDLIRPTDLFIDNNDTVYVSELCERISIFTNDGKLLARWSNEKGKDFDKALFVSCHTIAVDSRGDLYVGEVSNADYGIDRKSKTLRKFVKR
jgi:DNA-binding beta-propeller fold protein YncE